jgi:hypothetical protein
VESQPSSGSRPPDAVVIFAAASFLKDTVNRIGDLLDDGQPNSSFKG